MSDIEYPQVTVTAVWKPRARMGAYWDLTIVGCPFCGAREHHHGGSGDHDSVLYGSRVRHCLPEHKAFRADCVVERRKGQRSRCRIDHTGCDQYDLVPA